MDGLELRIETLESENADLKAKMRKMKGSMEEDLEAGSGSGEGI